MQDRRIEPPASLRLADRSEVNSISPATMVLKRKPSSSSVVRRTVSLHCPLHGMGELWIQVVYGRAEVPSPSVQT